jgi:hypothetical protein
MAKIKSKDQPLLVPPKNHREGWCESSYEDTYPQIAYDLLCSDWGISKAHIARSLGCCRSTVDDWSAAHPEFAKAIEMGMAYGESLYRDKVQKFAFEPSKEVNNGLIKLIGRNIYDIGDNPEPIVIVNNTVTSKSAEAQLTARGIPVPGVGVDDLEVSDD